MVQLSDGRVMPLSQYLAPGPDDPVVVTPDGASMTVNAFFWYGGGDPKDWITYQDDHEVTHIELKSDFARQGPMVDVPGRGEIPLGQLVLDSGGSLQSGGWLVLQDPATGQLHATKASDYAGQVSWALESMTGLSSLMDQKSLDVASTLATLNAAVGDVPLAIGTDSDLVGDAQSTYRDAHARVENALRALAGGLGQVGDGLAGSVGTLRDAEAANLGNAGFPVPGRPPSSRIRLS